MGAMQTERSAAQKALLFYQAEGVRNHYDITINGSPFLTAL